jgi:hypothetical protein
MSDGSGPVTIRVDGRLDIWAAGRIVERLRNAPADSEVLIDVGPGAQCEVVALSYIAEAMERRLTAPVRVRGLSGHDARILAYLGVELPSSDGEDPSD